MTIEQQYYENDSFWTLENVKIQDINRIEETFQAIPSNIKNIADIGCGNGLFLNYIRDKDPEIKTVGIDNSKSALKYVQTKTIKSDITSIPLKNNSYDLVSALEVIEHLPNNKYNKTLEELSRISKKFILISVPKNENLKDNFVECPYCESKFNRNFHKRTFSSVDLENLFLEEGFKCLFVKAIGTTTNYFLLSNFYKALNKYSKKRRQQFFSICPFCQFKIHNHSPKGDMNKKQEIYKTLIKKIKSFWPKYQKANWFLALYKKC